MVVGGVGGAIVNLMGVSLKAMLEGSRVSGDAKREDLFTESADPPCGGHQAAERPLVESLKSVES